MAKYPYPQQRALSIKPVNVLPAASTDSTASLDADDARFSLASLTIHYACCDSVTCGYTSH
ncbi:hypothetical protein CANCADRAFT_32236 [Tortispora caseinolytica NRRL Y-17796]|uniref:Uncharacterized protein n=1 Tax=Tortispora caseinolytica NRRL Y-17796 TaxID=767744 RepID=A0A1E4TAB6_9ASCO|nr:hypothetical protein CANCADRAFT_32236 [Tortispora caseinolytica NRRL Y-17796]